MEKTYIVTVIQQGRITPKGEFYGPDKSRNLQAALKLGKDLMAQGYSVTVMCDGEVVWVSPDVAIPAPEDAPENAPENEPEASPEMAETFAN